MSINKKVIQTNTAPSAIGAYSQAISVDSSAKTVYISGQIPLAPETMTLIGSNIEEQIHQVFKNLRAMCIASGGNTSDIVKLNVYLTDLSNFATVNTIMAEYFDTPFPARAALGINQLPKDSLIEIDGVMCL